MRLRYLLCANFNPAPNSCGQTSSDISSAVTRLALVKDTIVLSFQPPNAPDQPATLLVHRPSSACLLLPQRKKVTLPQWAEDTARRDLRSTQVLAHPVSVVQ